MLGLASCINLRVFNIFRTQCLYGSVCRGSEIKLITPFYKKWAGEVNETGPIDDANLPSFFCSTTYVPKRWKKFISNYRKVKSDKKKTLEKQSTVKNLDIIREYRTCLTIDENGKSLGVLSTFSALELARKRNYDLVLVRSGEPPVCKFIEITESLSDKVLNRRLMNSRVPLIQGVAIIRDKLKEVRISDNITEHDLQNKVEIMRKLLRSRYRLKIVLNFKKKEEFDLTFAKEIMNNIKTRLSDISRLEHDLKTMNQYATLVLKPTESTLSEAAKNEEIRIKESQEFSAARTEQTKEKARKHQTLLENSDLVERQNQRANVRSRDPQKQFIGFLKEFGLTMRNLPDRETLAKLLQIKIRRDKLKEKGIDIQHQVAAIATNQKANVYDPKKVAESEWKNRQAFEERGEDNDLFEEYQDFEKNELLDNSLDAELRDQNNFNRTAKLRLTSKKSKKPLVKRVKSSSEKK